MGSRGLPYLQTLSQCRSSKFLLYNATEIVSGHFTCRVGLDHILEGKNFPLTATDPGSEVDGHLDYWPTGPVKEL